MTVKHNGWSRSRLQWKRCTPVAETALWKPDCRFLGVRTPSAVPQRYCRTLRRESTPVSTPAFFGRLQRIGTRDHTSTQSFSEASPVVRCVEQYFAIA